MEISKSQAVVTFWGESLEALKQCLYGKTTMKEIEMAHFEETRYFQSSN